MFTFMLHHDKSLGIGAISTKHRRQISHIKADSIVLNKF